MKILEINESHYPVGGAEEYFFEIAEALRERGNRVKSLGFGKENIETEEKVVIKETKSDFGRYFWRLIPYPKISKKIRKTVEDFNPDVVHIHNINKYTFSILLSIQDQKSLHTVHDFLLVCPGLWCVKKDTLEVCSGGFGLKCLRHGCFKWRYAPGLIPFFYTRNRILKKIVNQYHTPSKTLKKYLENHGFNPVNSFPLPFETSKRISGEETKDNRILFVGGLEKQKGVYQLLKAAKKLNGSETDYNLHIVGKGSERENLEKYVEENNLSDSVTLTGWVSKERLEEEYKEAKFLVIPSIWQENAPVVISEALSKGVPVLGSDRGGIPEFVKDGKTGFIFDALNPEDVGKKIEGALNLPMGDYRKMREESVKFAEKTYDKERHLDNLENLLNEIIQE